MERQVIPEGLAEVPPGPELGVLLADIDPARLSGPDCVTVLRAQGRQVAHQQAQFLAVVAETGLCGIGPDEQVVREENPSEFAADEIRAALVWSRRRSDTQLVLALDLTRRLPQVHAALEHGEIDLPKAMTFADWTRDLTPEQARTVCARLLPAAPGLTVGELIDALKRLAIAIDPEWAARRYRQAVTERRVVGYRDLDGTATLSGLGLPVEEAAAACARIDALARRVKRAGDLRGIDQIRADLFLRLLDGSYEGWNETAIIADMIRRPPGTGQDASAPDASPAAGDRRSRMSPADAPTDPSVPKTGGRPQPSADRPADEDARLPTSGRAGVELRVRLSTLLDLNDHPAEIPGWGPIIADRARRIARRQARAEWRFAVCDAEGRLVGTGLISRRPTGCSRRSPVHGGIVELQIPLDLLHALTAVPGLHPEWAPVISEVAAQLADAPGPHHGDRPSDSRADGRTDSHNGSRTDNGTDGHTADDPPGGEPVGEDGPARGQDRRSPSAAVRRHVQIRDSRCRFPGCRMSASATDADHRTQHRHGGRTDDHNLQSLCRHDHRAKDEGGWSAISPQPGLVRWTSPLGQVYDVRPPLVIAPLPLPQPRPQVSDPRRGPGPDRVGPIWWEPSPPPEPEPPPDPPPDHMPPPF